MLTNGNQVLLIVSVVLFGLGFLCLILSIVILVKQSLGRGIQTIAESTTKLAEKGIAEGVASLLISSLNDLAKSNTGIGIFFVFLSLVLFAGAYYMLKPFIGALP